MRKQHNHSAVIDPLVVERLLRNGCRIGDIADYYKVDRKTFYNRINQEPVLRAAVHRGRKAKRVPMFSTFEIKTNTADVILLNLYELLNDVKLLKGRIAA